MITCSPTWLYDCLQRALL